MLTRGYPVMPTVSYLIPPNPFQSILTYPFPGELWMHRIVMSS